MNNRYKNPYFWVGLLGVIVAAMGAKPENFTSWASVYEAVKGLVLNPYMIVSVAMAVIGVFVDPTTKGITDGKKEAQDD